MTSRAKSTKPRRPPTYGPPQVQLGLLPDADPLLRRVRRRNAEPQLALFLGSEILGPLRFVGCPWGPLGIAFSLRVQGLPPQPTLPTDPDPQERS